MNICIVSGYFNPIHPGHISMIQDVRRSYPTCELVVIVNNDHQVTLKESIPFLDESARCEIVNNIKGVDYTVLSIDKDLSIAKTIESIVKNNRYKNYSIGQKRIKFCNGGDRNLNSSNSQELEICQKYDIDIEYGYGGSKIYSSSNLIDNTYKYIIKNLFWKNIVKDLSTKLDIKA